MTNQYHRLLELLPNDPLLVGEVTAHNADGTSEITLPDGGIFTARRQAVAVGLQAFVQAGEVKGEAPDLPVETIQI